MPSINLDVEYSKQSTSVCVRVCVRGVVCFSHDRTTVTPKLCVCVHSALAQQLHLSHSVRRVPAVRMRKRRKRQRQRPRSSGKEKPHDERGGERTLRHISRAALVYFTCVSFVL